MEDVLDVYHRDYGEDEVLVCMDETSRQQVKETRVPRPAAPGRAAVYDHEYERNGTSNLFMLFAPLAGWRRVEATERRTRVDWARLVRDLLDVHFPDKRVVLVMDNLNTHAPGSLYEAFEPAEARRLARRFEIHYTPKHHRVDPELACLNALCPPTIRIWKFPERPRQRGGRRPSLLQTAFPTARAPSLYCLTGSRPWTPRGKRSTAHRASAHQRSTRSAIGRPGSTTTSPLATNRVAAAPAQRWHVVEHAQRDQHWRAPGNGLPDPVRHAGSAGPPPTGTGPGAAATARPTIKGAMFWRGRCHRAIQMPSPTTEGSDAKRRLTMLRPRHRSQIAEGGKRDATSVLKRAMFPPVGG